MIIGPDRKSRIERDMDTHRPRETPRQRRERITAICAVVLVAIIVGTCLWLYIAQPGMLGM